MEAELQDFIRTQQKSPIDFTNKGFEVNQRKQAEIEDQDPVMIEFRSNLGVLPREQLLNRQPSPPTDNRQPELPWVGMSARMQNAYAQVAARAMGSESNLDLSS